MAIPFVSDALSAGAFVGGAFAAYRAQATHRAVGKANGGGSLSDMAHRIEALQQYQSTRNHDVMESQSRMQATLFLIFAGVKPPSVTEGAAMVEKVIDQLGLYRAPKSTGPSS